MRRLGTQTARVLGEESDASVPVVGTEFYDIAEEIPAGPGLLILMPSSVSIAPDELRAIAMLAGEQGHAGLCLKCPEERIAELNAIARDAQMPIVRVASELNWRLFEAAITQTLGEHHRLDDLQRDPGLDPLFALCNELAEFFGGSVAIEDLGRRIVAYSSVEGQLIDSLRTRGILSRQVPSSPFNDDQYRTVLRSYVPIKYPRLDDEEPRVAVAVRAGALPLGTIWAIDASGEAPITDEQERRIVRAAELASGVLLESLRSQRATQRPREACFRRLLAGSGLTGAELAELGISDERGVALLVFDRADSESSSAVLAQLRDTVVRHLELTQPNMVAVVHHGRVHALLPAVSLSEAVVLVEPLLALIDRLVGGGTRVAVADGIHRPSAVVGRRELAERMLFVAPDARILTIDAVRPALVRERAVTALAEDTELHDPAVSALLAAKGGAALALTLLEWLRCQGNVAKTAQHLLVHENTVRQRLARAETEFGLRLSASDELLAVWLQLLASAPVAAGGSGC